MRPHPLPVISEIGHTLFVTGLLFLCSVCFSIALAAGTSALKHRYDLTTAGGTPLSMPTDVVVTPNGNVVVVDGGNDRIVMFDSDGDFIRSIGHTGSGKSMFSAPLGIGVDNSGHIYVADSGNYRIQVFHSDGSYLFEIPTIYKKKSIRPVDVAISPGGDKVYVTGSSNHSVMIYSLTRVFSHMLLKVFGGEGSNPAEFRYPATIVCTKEGDLYVTDVLNSRIQKFDEKGKLLTSVGSWGVLPGQLFRPKGVAVDDKGHIYISDSYLEVIQEFDSDTNFSHVLEDKNKPKRFTTPVGITIDNHHNIYIAEMLANRVSVYRVGSK